MPILTKLLSEVTPALLREDGYRSHVRPEHCLILAHIHVLDSTVDMLRRLMELGFQSHLIMIVPKPYSTVANARAAVRALGCAIVEDWLSFVPGRYDFAASKPLRKACELARERGGSDIKRFILLDDGGLLTDECWRFNLGGTQTEVVSVQQTASGFFRNRLTSDVPRVDVARSAAKKHFEADIIVKGVIRKVKSMSDLSHFKRVGVVGLGAVGRELARVLNQDMGKTIFAYDIDPTKEVANTLRMKDWLECIHKADAVFGCTGKNFMAGALHRLSEFGNRHLISLSSRDVEFKEILEQWVGRRPLSYFPMLKVKTDCLGPFYVHNCGFPINFDREKEWESHAEISLTRALVVLGVLQALCVPLRRGTVHKLGTSSQRKLVQSWLRERGKRCGEFGISEAQFEDRDWWYRQSGASVLEKSA